MFLLLQRIFSRACSENNSKLGLDINKYSAIIFLTVIIRMNSPQLNWSILTIKLKFIVISDTDIAIYAMPAISVENTGIILIIPISFSN